jgi:phosphatidylglycerophosphate synthase
VDDGRALRRSRSVGGVVDRALRPVKARLLAPLAGALADVPPAALTTVGLVVGLAAAAAAAWGAFALALGLWLVNRLVDGLDGEVARLPRPGGSRQSERGAYLDVMVDLTVYAAVTVGAAAGATASLGGEPLTDPTSTWALAALLLAAYYVNLGSWTLVAALLEARGAGRGALARDTSLVMPAGLVEGVETIVLIALALALPHLMPWWFATGAALVTLTAIQRAAWWFGRLGAA